MSAVPNVITRKWSEEYPELGTGPVPVEPSISQEYFELERERIFRKVWLHIGCRVEEIPEPGDYFVKEIKMCNASVLVVRGKDGVIRGFHNVCTHRGNKLAWDERGSLTAISCKFHGWTFDLQGRLTRVPDEDQFHDLKKSEHNLIPVATDVWEGFIFINLDPKPKESLKEYLGELWDGLAGYPFGKLSPCYEYNGEIKCNWKTCKGAFQEGYHAPFLHARSANRWITRKENPLAHLPAFKIFGPHDMMSVPANANVRPTPTGALAARLARSMTRLHTREAKDLEGLPRLMNPSKDPNWAFDTFILFPNFQVQLWSTGWYLATSFWPLAVDRVLMQRRVYFPAPKNAGERFAQEFSKRTNRDVNMEDLSTLEYTQEGLASGALTHVLLQEQEIAVRHFHKVVEEYVRSP